MKIQGKRATIIRMIVGQSECIDGRLLESCSVESGVSHAISEFKKYKNEGLVCKIDLSSNTQTKRASASSINLKSAGINGLREAKMAEELGGKGNGF